MFKILTLNKIADCGMNELPQDKFSVSSEEKNADGIMVRSAVIPPEDLNAGLLGIARAGAGVNNIPVDVCSDKGIVVFNTPGANANAVKELVIAGMLMSSRNVVGGIAWAQGLAGQEGVAALVEKGKSQFTGPEITGKTLGVVGLGAIGMLTANASVALGMKVVGYDPFLSPEAAKKISSEVQIVSDLDALYAQSDYMSLNLPVNKDTKGMFNAEVFAKCKKGLRLLNFARAELVDLPSLKKAIADGIVSCYVTDFPNEDMLGVEGIIPIPHLGASTPESEDNCATMAGAQLREFLLYGNIKNSVNFPACELPYAGKKRVCVMHRDALDAVTAAFDGKIAGKAAADKKGLGYAIIDTDGDAAAIEAKLQKTDGVIKVRVI